MKARSFDFHHPIAFWTGCAAISSGVLAHMPMFLMGRHNGYQMVGMEMDATMLGGMALILLGTLLSGYGLTPRVANTRRELPTDKPAKFYIADHTRLNNAHWKLFAVLIIALVVDVLKPATLGFVVPGMMREYEISKASVSVLALFALAGTTIGSIVWGWLADVFGRRSSILLSALLFIGTSICGAMPTFEWNLAMCFLMGMSAGGLLPIAFTVIAESVPTAHRGWMLVALGAIGTSGGYLLAAGSAALLVPEFSWRALWLLGLPTGLLIVFLGRYIPESPRFLAAAGFESEIRAVSGPFACAQASLPPESPAAFANGGELPTSSRVQLLLGSHATITWCLILCGIAWGIVNFGFLLWLPTNLDSMGMDPVVSRWLLTNSALLALPGTAIAIWLYYRWSSINSLVLFIVLTAAALLMFFLLGLAHVRSTMAIALVTAAMLMGSTGVIAMLIPYAAEVYPTYSRGTGTGLIAASSKLGGVLGACLGALGGAGLDQLLASPILVTVPLIVAAILLVRYGVETRGRSLEDVHNTFAIEDRASKAQLDRFSNDRDR